jgi:hypothetical protein
MLRNTHTACLVNTIYGILRYDFSAYMITVSLFPSNSVFADCELITRRTVGQATAPLLRVITDDEECRGMCTVWFRCQQNLCE